MEIRVLKLVNGDEIVTEVELNSAEMQSQAIKVRRPRVCQMVPMGEQVGIALVPWMVTAPDFEGYLDRDNIMVDISAPKNVADNYLQQVSRIFMGAQGNMSN